MNKHSSTSHLRAIESKAQQEMSRTKYQVRAFEFHGDARMRHCAIGAGMAGHTSLQMANAMEGLSTTYSQACSTLWLRLRPASCLFLQGVREQVATGLAKSRCCERKCGHA